MFPNSFQLAVCTSKAQGYAYSDPEIWDGDWGSRQGRLKVLRETANQTEHIISSH